MASYKDAEIRKGRIVIRANVEVVSAVPITGQAAGVTEWRGILRPRNNIRLTQGEFYTLVLSGFLPARIEICEEPNPVDGSVRFKGVGPLPKECGG